MTQGRDLLPACLRDDAAAIRGNIRAEFAHLEQHVFAKHRGVFSADAFSFEQYCWAKECVLSRAYAVEGLGDLVCLLPGIDMANHAVDVAYGVTCTEHEAGSAAGADRGAEAAGNEVGEAEPEEMVRLVVDRAYTEGEEVWSSYGPLDKSRLCVSCPALPTSAPCAPAAPLARPPSRPIECLLLGLVRRVTCRRARLLTVSRLFRLVFFGFVAPEAADVLRINIPLPQDETQVRERTCLPSPPMLSSSYARPPCRRMELVANTKQLTHCVDVQHARATLLQANGLGVSSRLELSAPGAARGSSVARIPPPEEALTFARICALGPAAALRAAEAVGQGEDAAVPGRGTEVGTEVEAEALALLQQAVAAACAAEGGVAREALAGDGASGWQAKTAQQLVAGQLALAAGVNVWLRDELRSTGHRTSCAPPAKRELGPA